MSDKDKQQRYLEISKQITEQVGGKENIVASTHCANAAAHRAERLRQDQQGGHR